MVVMKWLLVPIDYNKLQNNFAYGPKHTPMNFLRFHIRKKKK